MTRKSPVKHKVKSHTRSGIAVKNYERGKGKRVEKEKTMHITANIGYNVSFWFSNGSRETFNLPEKTIGSALRAGISKIQQPLIPVRAQIRSRMERK